MKFHNGRTVPTLEDLGPAPTSPEIRAAHWRIYYATGSRIALRLANA